MNLVACGSYYEGQLRFPPNYTPSRMDYKQKAVTVPPPPKSQQGADDDDEDDLEALREAALRSLGRLGSNQNKQKPQQQTQITTQRAPQSHRHQYKNHPLPRGGNYTKRQQRQNGIKGFYYHIPRNPNLIEIVPMDETANNERSTSPNEKKENCTSDIQDKLESTKFQRYKDDASGSEDEDHKCILNPSAKKELGEAMDGSINKENQSDVENSPAHSKDSEDKSADEKAPDDDDDVLLMADLEEEVSLDRLMDEMEREINDGKSIDEKKFNKKLTEKPTKQSSSKPQPEQVIGRKRSKSPPTKRKSPLAISRTEQRVSLPYESSRNCHKRRSSLSPKMRSRKRSPRRSPRRSPIRQKPRYKSPMRYSPRPRSPRAGSPPPPRSTSRCQNSRPDSPKSPLRSRRLSPRRSRSPPLRFRSPKQSPWSSPRNSPRDWSPKESAKRPRSASASRDRAQERGPSPVPFDRVSSPTYRSRSPEVARPKIKTKDEISEKAPLTSEVMKVANSEAPIDPVLEARRKKFESAIPINPNKKIKLTKKEDAVKKIEEEIKEDSVLALDASYDFLEVDNALVEEVSVDVTETDDACVSVEDVKLEKERSSKKRRKKDKELYQIGKLKELPLSERIGKEKKSSRRHRDSSSPVEEVGNTIVEDLAIDEEGDLRAELSRRRAERLNRAVPIQSARLLQSAFKGVVKEVAKNNAKVNQRHLIKGDDKLNQKEVRRVTVLHRSISELHDSEDDSNIDSKVPIRFRLGITKNVQEPRESKVSRKSKRQNRKVKHKNNLPVDSQHLL